MDWHLAHRTIGSATATHTELDAPTSHEAIAELRSRLPETEQILFIRKVTPPQPVMPRDE